MKDASLFVALLKSSGGNPNHDDHGRFASGGGGGHASHYDSPDPGGITTKVRALASEAESLRRYQSGGYDKHNEALRSGQAGSHAESTKHIDNLVSRHALTQDAEVYRGVHLDGAPWSDAVRSAKPGDVLSDPAYMSATTSYSAATELFAKPSANGDGPGKAVYHVSLKAGHHAVPVSAVTNRGKERQAFHTTEKELLLGRNTKLRVKSVRREGDTYHIHADAES